MTSVTLTAGQIAERHLLAALRLWKEGDFLSALTLAGAAEEILGKRLRASDQKPSFEQLRDLMVAVSDVEGSKTMMPNVAADLINRRKNEIKHYSGDEPLVLDLREEASEILDRAIDNYQRLNGGVPDAVLEYWLLAAEAARPAVPPSV